MTETASDTPDALTDAHVKAWARMVRGTTQVLRTVEEALKAAGLPALSWYDVLLELRRAGPEGMRPVRLQKEMLIPQYNMSRLIDRLEAAGHVRREMCDDDGRGQIVKITPSGEDLLRRMWPIYAQALRTSFAGAIPETAAKDIADGLNAFGSSKR